MKIFISTVALFFLLNPLFSQDFYLSIPAGGNWTNAATWDLDFDGVGGDGVPGPNDVAVITGDGAGGGAVFVNANVTVGDVYIVSDAPNVLRKSGFGNRILTINGQLTGTSPDLDGNPAVPTVDVILDNTSFSLLFTGASAVNPVITSWSHVATINNLTFDQTGTNTNFQIEDVAVINNFNVNDGTVTITSGSAVVQAGTNSLITVASGAILNVNGAINGDGDPSSLFTTVTINGTASVGSNGYLNSGNFNLNSGAVLNVSNDQPNGWFNGTAAPNNNGIDANSTVRYTRTAAQGIAARTYGHLEISSGGVAATKTLSATGTLTVQGNLTTGGSTTFTSSANGTQISIGGNLTNNGTWAPTQQIIFNGTAAQTIQGLNSVTFGGGINISNTGGTVALNNVGADINGVFDIDAGATFNSADGVVTASGNLQIDGTLMAGTDPGAFVFDGTTVFQGSGSRNFNDVTITGEVTAPAGVISVAGDFANNGTFTANGGTVTFNGIGAQSITTSTSLAFQNITIANTSNTVAINSATNLIGRVTLADNSSFNAAGNLTLVSNSLGTATVAAIPSTASFSGNVIYQRYFGGSGEYWRNWGTPVAGTVTDITNAGFTINGNDLAYYNEAATGTVNDGWVLQSTFGATIGDQRGYTQWTRVEELPATISITGALNTGDITLTTSYTNHGSLPDDGWNMVNNPYASTVDWGSANWIKTNLDAAAYVWDGAQYITLTGTSGDLISSGQAFWVKANGNGATTLTARQNVKNNTSTAFLRTQEENLNWLKISLFNGENEDIAHIRFRSDASEEFDSKYDGYKLPNVIYNFSSVTQAGMDLSVNTLPETDCNRVVKLKLTNVSVGDYEMQFNDLNSLTVGYMVSLVDNFDGSTVSISEGDTYAFQVTSDPTTFGFDRFEVVFETPEIDQTIDFDPTAEVSCMDYVSIHLNNTQSGISYSVLNVENTAISNIKVGTGGPLTLFVQKDALIEGNNTVSLLQGGNSACISAIKLSDFLSIDLPAEVAVSEVENATFCGENSVILKANGAIAGSLYRWYETLGSEIPLAEDALGEFETPVLKKSSSFYVAIVSENGCESDRVAVNAQKVNLAPPVAEGGQFCGTGSVILTASGAGENEFYKWYESSNANAALAETADGNFVTPEISESKSYYVAVATTKGCESDRVAVSAQKVNLAAPVAEGGQFCGTGSAILTASGAGENEFYKWYESSVATTVLAETVDGSFATPEISESKSYYVAVANTKGCESDRVAVKAQKVSLIMPTAFSGTACNTGTVTLTASGAAAGEFYKWYDTSEATESLATTTEGLFVTPEISQTTIYYVAIANSAGCISERAEAIGEILKVENPIITVSGQLLSVGLADSYQWLLNGEPIPGATAQTFEAKVNGVYEVTITMGVCEITSDTQEIFVTSIDKALYDLGVSIYPNPMSSVINITGFKRDSDISALDFIMYDSKGQQMLNKSDIKNNGESYYFNVGNLKGGLYILNIYDKNRIIAVRLQKN